MGVWAGASSWIQVRLADGSYLLVGGGSPDGDGRATLRVVSSTSRLAVSSA